MEQSGDPVRVSDNPGFEAIHGLMLRHFGALVRDLGGNPAPFLEEVGIRLSAYPRDQIRVTYRQFVPLLERAAGALNCPDFGMQLARRQADTAFGGPLGDGMRAARNFDEALNFVCGHSYAHSLAAWIWRKPSMSGRNTLVGHDILLSGLAQRSQTMEYLLLVGNLATAQLTDDRVRARQVLFRHQPISEPRIYRRNFGCEVRFGRSADAVVYSPTDLACPIAAAPDAQAYRAAGAVIEARFPRHEPPLHANIRGMIIHLLDTEYCTKEYIAAEMGMHLRTMSRRLADEGSSFQMIKDQVRRDRMLYYIEQTRLDFTAISERLGFSEQAVMTRCCRKWFGMSPTALRARTARGAETPANVPNGQATVRKQLLA